MIRTGQTIKGYSRRKVLAYLASLLLPLSVEGCAQSLSSSTTAPTPTSHPPGSVLSTYRHHTNRVTTVAWSPNGTYIASGSLDQTVQVWVATTNTHFQTSIYRGHTAGVQSVAWSPDGKLIASGSSDKTVQVWDALTAEHAATYSGHSDIVLTVAWAPNGKSIASGSADGTVRLWDVATGMQKYIYRGHTASVNSITWSPDSQRVASASSDKIVQIMDATNGDHVYTYRGHTNIVSSVSWSPKGKLIASGSWDKTVQVWDATTGNRLYTYRGYNVEAAKYNNDTGVLPDLILAVAWSHNGKRIAAVTQVYCGDSCGVVVAWDAYTEHHFSFYIDVPVFALAWSPDDTRFATSLEVSTQRSNMKATDGAYVEISQA
ncbi:MAG: WD40 repeat domain-containing protein [Ktedonobacteraceae bacterium]|nr:WD40 repeat domain-containing protein [Ktedonobacteraceae bacterium]